MSIEVIDYLLSEIKYWHQFSSIKGEMIDLTEIKSIYYFLDKNTTLSSHQMKEIKKIISKLKTDVNNLNKLKELLTLNLEIEQSTFHQVCLTLKFNKYDYFEYIKKIKLDNDNEAQIAYYQKEKNWFGNLVIIYLRHEGKLPISTLHFFKYLKKNFETIPKDDQQIIIHATEDILGGNNLDLISTNFQDWICNNITDIKILKDFLIF